MFNTFYFILSRFFAVFLLSTFYFLLSTPVKAAELYFGAHMQEVAVGQTLEVGVFLNTDGQQVNAVEGSVTFPSDLLEAQEIRDGGSIVSFWIERPSVARETDAKQERETDAVRFSGIIPGGHEGRRGYLFSMMLRAKAAGEATITTRNDQVLLHDGEGTPAALRRSPLILRIKETGIVPEFVPPLDTDLPESFVPEITRDLNMFEGKWFLVFVGQDKGAGIDHFEVQESRKQKVENRKWIEAESPYALRDQKLRSFIAVKAVDKAGNERVAMVPPRYPLPWYADFRIWGILVAGIVVAFGVWRVLKTRH